MPPFAEAPRGHMERAKERAKVGASLGDVKPAQQGREHPGHIKRNLESDLASGKSVQNDSFLIFAIYLNAFWCYYIFFIIIF